MRGFCPVVSFLRNGKAHEIPLLYYIGMHFKFCGQSVSTMRKNTKLADAKGEVQEMALPSS